MLSYNDTTEKPSPERSRDEASFYVIYKTYPNLTTTPYKQFMLKVHGFNEDGTYGYNIIYVDTL